MSLLIEFQHIDIEDGEVFGLKLVLLRLEQVILSCSELNDILQSQLKLLAQQIVTGLSTLAANLSRLELTLVGCCLQPVILNGRIELSLLVLQVELNAFALNQRLVHLCLGRAVLKERNADTNAASNIEVGLQLLAQACTWKYCWL